MDAASTDLGDIITLIATHSPRLFDLVVNAETGLLSSPVSLLGLHIYTGLFLWRLPTLIRSISGICAVLVVHVGYISAAACLVTYAIMLLPYNLAMSGTISNLRSQVAKYS